MNSFNLIRCITTQSTVRSLTQSTIRPSNQSVTRSFHSSRQSSGINEFFSGATLGKTGREWSCADLRLKSFDDLHKLWFVLLKERNMLFTYQQYCKSSLLTPIHMERFHKVKKSMAHIKRVLHERHLEVKEATEPAGSTWRLARENRLAAGHKRAEVKSQRLTQPKQYIRQKEGHSMAKKIALRKYKPVAPPSGQQAAQPGKLMTALRSKRLKSSIARKNAAQAAAAQSSEQQTAAQ